MMEVKKERFKLKDFGNQLGLSFSSNMLTTDKNNRHISPQFQCGVPHCCLRIPASYLIW